MLLATIANLLLL